MMTRACGEIGCFVLIFYPNLIGKKCQICEISQAKIGKEKKKNLISSSLNELICKNKLLILKW